MFVNDSKADSMPFVSHILQGICNRGQVKRGSKDSCNPISFVSYDRT